ncbi:MAG: hypothetical protein ACYCRG_07600 [Acidimicrobiales bacterium]
MRPTRTRRVALLASVAASALAPALPLSAAPVAHAVPACLRGTWRELDETDAYSYADHPLTLRGDAGRTLTFSAPDREVASYARATPLRGDVLGRPYVMRLRGRVLYTIAVRGDTLSFTTTRPESLSVTVTYAGRTRHLAPATTTAPVSFTCSTGRLVQAGRGYHATFVRVG